MHEKGVQPKDIANACGTYRQRVNKWIHEGYLPEDEGMINPLLKILDTTYDYLLYGEPQGLTKFQIVKQAVDETLARRADQISAAAYSRLLDQILADIEKEDAEALKEKSKGYVKQLI